MGVVHFGPLLWSGSVEVFRLIGDAPASHAFAWSRVDGGQLHCFVVLKSEEVDSAQAAVRHVLAKHLAVNDQPAAA